MNIRELKAAVQKYLDITLLLEKEYMEENILYQAVTLPMEADLMSDMEPTFSQTLFQMIKEKGISETECYKNANLDRRLFSKIRSNDDRDGLIWTTLGSKTMELVHQNLGVGDVHDNIDILHMDSELIDEFIEK